ncbi:acetyltransferase [Microbacterium bovistercoris]|uniref:Acetyltransferase n=1 Tax=Microbacterium bovistercoris TaxID=2293570 RepID=A0A371NX60_9MICO|nr:acetyltransferase [Microbacterium bovistercoris]REJ07727.1 acetyltransferase [Microbacterium bovistercoris]
MPMDIRPVDGRDEYPRLVQIWRSAVDATHGFLAAADRDDIEAHLASDHLPQVDVHVAEREGRIVGFVGIADDKVEMLFVDAAEHGRGAGTALLSFALDHGAVAVDVNEQNTAAVEFYQRRGFTAVGRSSRDDQGRPYPLLRMRHRVPAWEGISTADLQRLHCQATHDAIERALQRGGDAWMDWRLPVIDRGRHAIFPLVVADASGDGTTVAETIGRLRTHWGYLHGGHDYRLGHLDETEGYGRKLAEAGAAGRNPFWWAVGGHAVVFVHSADDGAETLALHVVPLEWVRRHPSETTKRTNSRGRRALRQSEEVAVTWTWSDVVLPGRGRMDAWHPSRP